MIGLLLAMYPARWRRRYGEEFRAVLESRPLGPFDFADVLIGALDARLAPRRLSGVAPLQGGHLMLRLGGIGAIAGGTLWFVGLAGSGLSTGDDATWGPVLGLGTIGLLFALVGLSAFQAQRDPKLAWAAFAIPGTGTLISVVGIAAMGMMPEGALLFGSFSPWYVWVLGLLGTLVGSIIFALATIRAAVFSRLAAQGLGASSAVVIVVAFGAMGIGASQETMGWVFALAAAAFATSWVALGVGALRRGPIRAIVPASPS